MITPKPYSYNEFPESEIFADGIEVIGADNTETSCTMHLNVKYAEKDGMPLHVHIIEPQQGEDKHDIYPLAIYVQGSAWLKQKTAMKLPQLSRFARRGFVVASVEYRPSTLSPFPAQIQDTKSAIRYMIKNAAVYHVDPSNIVVWGDSSGGHTAVMTGFTMNSGLLEESRENEPVSSITEQDPCDLSMDKSDKQDSFDLSEIREISSIKAIIDYYGPVDIGKMNEEPSTMDHISPDSPEGLLIGGHNVLENPEKVKPTITLNYISNQRAVPPVLILHGNKDRLVPFGQSVMLYKALKQNSKEVRCYQLKGADHGGPAFWTDHILDMVESFIRDCLKKQ